MANQADPEEQDKDPAELEAGRMPFLRHLAELRDRVRNAAIIFFVGFLVCWYFSHDLFNWLCGPFVDMWNVHHGPGIPPAQDWGPPKLIYTGLTQPFWVDMSVGMWAGIFLTSPFIFHQLWRFIAPGLYKKERRVAIYFAGFSAVLFVSGALFCFEAALPKLYQFFLTYHDPTPTDGGIALIALPNIQDYLDLTRDMMLAFGAIFELPLLIFFLAMVGLVTHRSLWKFNRWFIVLAFIIGAVLTPGPDVVSQFMMATPMIVLYNISILLAWRVTKRREAKAAAEGARLADEEEDEDEAEDEE